MTRIVGICGSLRAASYNRGLLRAAAASLPPGATLEVAEIGALPLFNEDIEKPEWPEPVQGFRRVLWTADAVLVATPEYNAGIPGVLKNAIDWASRFEGLGGRTAPEGDARKTPLQDVPVAIMGATPGSLGTARSQQQLRTVLLNVGMRVMPSPEAYVGGAKGRFAEGELADEASRAQVAKVVAGLVAWAGLAGRRAT
ncbi:NADPH-dependent FMN reductase [Falsiroseomonas oryzae]|uniref:NADPH-dependent FMN reductase n=1 Tax=Falsiroseomonas oryzae TaxID=2766473 RepID=UPI0022EA5EFE|nr:NAD(P)H-dependent oxidoreductase [Roseomonas sp. MO-31]